MLKMEGRHVEVGIAPVADAFAGTTYTDIVNMEEHDTVTFVIFKGAGDTGTSTITVQACDDTTPSNTSAVAFRYRLTTGGSNPGAITTATTSGFATTAGASQLYEIEVRAEDLLSSGYSYVRLKAAEATDDAVLGGVLIVMDNPRWANSPTTATT